MDALSVIMIGWETIVTNLKKHYEEELVQLKQKHTKEMEELKNEFLVKSTVELRRKKRAVANFVFCPMCRLKDDDGYQVCVDCLALNK